MDTVMSNNDNKLSDAFVLFENRVNQLECNMSRVTAQTDQQVVCFSFLGFRGKDKANTWLAINEPTHDYGLFVDAHMGLDHVLHAIYGDESLITESRVMSLWIWGYG
jgi:hypothetical protein